MSAEEKARVDWESVEVHFRANIKSLRIIASEYGCTEGAIRKRAKKYEWTRDLSAKIKAKAAELVRKEEVRSVVRTETLTEKQQIDIGAEIRKDLIPGHRKDIGRARKLAIKLLEELEGVTNNPELIQQLAEMMQSQLEQEVGQKLANKLMEGFHKASSLPGRVGTMKMLWERRVRDNGNGMGGISTLKLRCTLVQYSAPLR